MTRRATKHKDRCKKPSGKQSRGVVIFVVVSHRRRASPLQRQPRSNACTWFLSSQHSSGTKACSRGGMYRPTMSSSFSTNFGSRDTLKVQPSAFEAIGLPNLEHGRIRKTELGGQFASAPVGSAFGCGQCDHTHNVYRIDRRFASAARQVCINRGKTVFGKPVAPRNDLSATDFESPCNRVIAKQRNLRTSSVCDRTRRASSICCSQVSMMLVP